jgi:hypothetical protein
MNKASDYRRQAQELRQDASSASPERRDELIAMANTWDILAQQHERKSALRRQRLRD